MAHVAAVAGVAAAAVAIDLRMALAALPRAARREQVGSPKATKATSKAVAGLKVTTVATRVAKASRRAPMVMTSAAVADVVDVVGVAVARAIATARRPPSPKLDANRQATDKAAIARKATVRRVIASNAIATLDRIGLAIAIAIETVDPIAMGAVTIGLSASRGPSHRHPSRSPIRCHSHRLHRLRGRCMADASAS